MNKNTTKAIALGLLFPLFIIGLFALNAVFAQSSPGKITGNVMTSQDGQRVPASYINVVLLQNDGFVMGALTDSVGSFSLSPVDAGTYSVKFSNPLENLEKTYDNIVVSSGATFRLDAVLDVIIGGKDGIVVYGNPIKVDANKVITEFDPHFIRNSGKRTPNELAAIAPGVYQSREGAVPSMRGARPSSTAYYIDGVKVIGVPAIAAVAIGHMEVIHGGIPAEFGDVTGGIINITTKNPRMVEFKAQAPRPKKKRNTKESEDEKDPRSLLLPEFEYELAANQP